MNLIRIKGNTYYFEEAICVGVYFLDEKNVLLIDSGSDKEYGRKILRFFEEKNVCIKGIINTHSHADHCGGNYFIQKRTNCDIFATEIEAAIIDNPLIEPLYLYGASPIDELKNKFLMAEKSKVTKHISPGIIELFDRELEIIDLSGHSLGMIGIRTDDNVAFIGDSLIEKKIIEKYGLLYCMDLSKVYGSLKVLQDLSSDFFIMSHGGLAENMEELIKANLESFNYINSTLLDFTKESSLTREELLSKLMNKLELKINIGQYFLNNSTISAHIAFLSNEGQLKHKIENNSLFWSLSKK